MPTATKAQNYPTTTLKGSYRICLALLVMSGAAALIYQVVWVRILSLSMGTTSVAVSSVVAAFFFGIAIGSYAAGLIEKDKVNIFKLYLILEFIIALSGLMTLVILLHLDSVMAMLPFWGTRPLIKFSITVLILVIPTACMGATFPIIVQACERYNLNRAGMLGQMYAFNTIGAVIGVLASGFLLIPYIGLKEATFIACALNLLAGFTAATQGKRLNLKISANNNPDTQQVKIQDTYSAKILGALALFCVGAASLGLEVAWTKYLSLFMGGTIYGFTAILSIFLIGISIGSWAFHRISKYILINQTTYLFGLLFLVGTLIFTRSTLTLAPYIVDAISDYKIQPLIYMASKYAIVLAILLLPTILLGALFPISMMIFSQDSKKPLSEFGTGYAINTLGGITGVMLTGLWLIPTIGTDQTIVFIILLLLVLIGFFTFFIPHSKSKLLSLFLTAFLGWQLYAFEGLNYQSMIMANPYRFDNHAQAGKVPEFLFLKEGKSSIISAITYNGSVAHLQSNGIQESYVTIKNNYPPPKAETLLGVLPYLLHKNPKSAFVIGYGGGHTTNALIDTPLDSIRIVELERAVVEAIESIAKHTTAALKDRRVDLVFNDARNTLLVNNTSYDLIVSQPSHPWLSRAGNLFTVEFFEIVSSRLNAGGIFTQWVNLFNMDTATLLSILKAFYTAFPYGFTTALTASGDLLVIGSNSPIVFDLVDIDKKISDTGVSNTLKHWEFSQAESIVDLFTLSREQILDSSQHLQTNTDNRILSEVRLANMVDDPTGEDSPYTWIKQTSNKDISQLFNSEHLPEALFQIGHYLKTNGQLKDVRHIYDQLRPLDPILAEKLITQ